MHGEGTNDVVFGRIPPSPNKERHCRVEQAARWLDLDDARLAWHGLMQDIEVPTALGGPEAGPVPDRQWSPRGPWKEQPRSRRRSGRAFLSSLWVPESAKRGAEVDDRLETPKRPPPDKEENKEEDDEDSQTEWGRQAIKRLQKTVKKKAGQMDERVGQVEDLLTATRLEAERQAAARLSQQHSGGGHLLGPAARPFQNGGREEPVTTSGRNRPTSSRVGPEFGQSGLESTAFGPTWPDLTQCPSNMGHPVRRNANCLGPLFAQRSASGNTETTAAVAQA